MIENLYRVVCNHPGCPETGPLAGSRISAWRRARDERHFTLLRSTSEHFCPRHSTDPVEIPAEIPAAAVPPAEAAALLAYITGAGCADCGRPFTPDHDAGAPGPTVRHPFIARKISRP